MVFVEEDPSTEVLLDGSASGWWILSMGGWDVTVSVLKLPPQSVHRMSSVLLEI